MGLPNIGPLELIIILAIALLIVGPGRLPEMGNAIGRTIREFRKASSDVGDATKLDSHPAAPAPNTLRDEATPNTTSAVSAAPAGGAAPAASDADVRASPDADARS